jgi:hypothetical protein
MMITSRKGTLKTCRAYSTPSQHFQLWKVVLIFTSMKSDFTRGAGAFKMPLSIAFPKLFDVVVSIQAKCDSSDQHDLAQAPPTIDGALLPMLIPYQCLKDGAKLLHTVLKTANICTTATLVDVVFPFYASLCSSEVGFEVEPSPCETLANIFKWFKFDVPEEDTPL